MPSQYTLQDIGWQLSYALLDRLNIFPTNANAPCSAQMPGGLSGQILNHDAAEYSELSLDVVEDAVVG